jgi:hypothetical protein
MQLDGLEELRLRRNRTLVLLNAPMKSAKIQVPLARANVITIIDADRFPSLRWRRELLTVNTNAVHLLEPVRVFCDVK